MKNFKYTFAILVGLIITVSTYGQALLSTYFIDRSLQRSAMNPAFSPKSNYISLPVLGGIEVGLGSNFGIDNFLFNKQGTLYTYLNQNVSAEEFISKMKYDPTIAINSDIKLLGVGCHIGTQGYLSFDFDAIVKGDLATPKELYYLTKLGMPESSSTYNLDNLDFCQLGYFQFAVAYKHDFSKLVPGLSVGARFKYIALAEAADVTVNKASLYMSEDKWMVQTDAEATVATPYLTYDPQSGSLKPTGKLNLAGGGVMFDLGAEYFLDLGMSGFRGLKFAASVTDLGKVTSKVENLTTFKSAGEVEFNGMSDVNINSDLSANLEKILDDLKGIANLENTTPTEKYTCRFKPMYYASVEAVFLDNKLTTGALYSNKYGFNELTVAINGKLSGFNASVTYNFLTSKSFGFLLSFIPKGGVSIFLGSDCIPTRFTPQFLPMSLNASFRAGLSILFNYSD